MELISHDEKAKEIFFEESLIMSSLLMLLMLDRHDECLRGEVMFAV